MIPSLIKLRRPLLAGFALAGALAQPATAQRIPAELPRYRIGWEDVLATGGVGAAGLVPILLADHLPHATCAPCDPTHLLGLDRNAVGPVRPGVARASDAMLVSTVFAAGALMLDARARQPGATNLEDLAVLTQALAVDGAVTEWTKVLFHRPRPYLYATGAQYQTPEDGLSFPSGHASVAFTAAAAYASMMQRRHQLRQHTGETVLLFAAASATAVLRVIARKHFPTDVLAGAVLGTATGWVVPQLHPVQ